MHASIITNLASWQEVFGTNLHFTRLEKVSNFSASNSILHIDVIQYNQSNAGLTMMIMLNQHVYDQMDINMCQKWYVFLQDLHCHFHMYSGPAFAVCSNGVSDVCQIMTNLNKIIDKLANAVYDVVNIASTVGQIIHEIHLANMIMQYAFNDMISKPHHQPDKIALTFGYILQ